MKPFLRKIFATVPALVLSCVPAFAQALPQINAAQPQSAQEENDNLLQAPKSEPMTRSRFNAMSSEERYAFEFRQSMRDAIRANVNGEIILQEDLRRETRRGNLILSREAKTQKEFYEKSEKLTWDTLNRMTEMYLLVGDFNEAGGTVPEEYLDTQINLRINREFDGDRGRYLAHLRKIGSNPAAERKKLRDAIIEQNQNWMISKNAPAEIAPMDVFRTYHQNIREYQMPESVEYSQIVIYAGASETDASVALAAKNLAERLQKKPDEFESAAKFYSRDEFRSEGGYVGWAAVKDRSELVIEKLKSVKNGEVTDVLELADASGQKMFIIFKRHNYREAGVKSLNDVRAQIENYLRAVAERKARDEKLDALRKRFYVQWY